MLSTLRSWGPVVVMGLLAALLLAGFAPAILAENPKPVIKQVPPSRTSAASGAEMFKAYCAVCHGIDAKGNGPAVPALKTAPGDMTLLAKQNGGKFPELRVFNAIRGEVGVAAHGSREMPIWGTVFQDMNRSDTAQTPLRIRNLTKYIESLQQK